MTGPEPWTLTNGYQYLVMAIKEPELDKILSVDTDKWQRLSSYGHQGNLTRPGPWTLKNGHPSLVMAIKKPKLD